MVYDDGDDETEIVLKGVVRAEKLPDPTDFVPAILSRVKEEYVRRLYGVAAWEDATDFMTKLAARYICLCTRRCRQHYVHEAFRACGGLCRRDTSQQMGRDNPDMLRPILVFEMRRSWFTAYVLQYILSSAARRYRRCSTLDDVCVCVTFCFK